MEFLELSEDEMVNWLSNLQRLSRAMLVAARNPATGAYNPIAHEKAVEAVFQELKWLSSKGDVV